MVECPHCNRSAMSLWRKSAIGPARVVNCLSRGKKVGLKLALPTANAKVVKELVVSAWWSKAPKIVAPAPRRPTPRVSGPDVQQALTALEELATKATLAGMARYAIPSNRAFGVPMAKVQSLAKRLGRNHQLAASLWKTGWYEARLLAAYVDEPAGVTSRQMERWCADFDSWALCDTVCFLLFDRTSHAWSKVEQWARHEDEFVKRAAFALLWGLSVHDKGASDGQFTQALQLVENAAMDERNFVRKSVNMALRAIGKRNPTLRVAALAAAERLAASPDKTAKWVGRNALQELASPAVALRLARKTSNARS